MRSYRYSNWDGTQEFPELGADDIMAELSDDLLSYGDLSYALQRLMQRGMTGQMNPRMRGLQDLLQQLRNRKQETLHKHNLNSILDDIQERLAQIEKAERAGIDRRLEEARQRHQEGQAAEQAGAPPKLSPEQAQKLMQNLESMASKNLEFLDNLPRDVGGAIKELSEYEFMDSDAKAQFDELMEMLKQRAMESYFRDMMSKMQSMSPDQMGAMNQMISDLNKMLRDKILGREPDFQGFMDKWGGFFGANPPQSLEELVEKLQRDLAQMQSLLESLPEDLRRSLEEMIESALDDETRQQLAQMAASLDYLFPSSELKNQYPFWGDEPISMSEALKLMEQLQKMDELERQLRKVQPGSDLSEVNEESLKELLGPEAANSWEQLKELLKRLEEAGYVKKTRDRLELTPKGMRKIGQKALLDIFQQLKKEHFGKHETADTGASTQREEDTKPYQFGDPFYLSLEKTLMNAVKRGESEGVPIQLKGEDFEVYRTQHLTQSATVLMLDLSLSMPMRGNFFAAKKVALALDSLIRTQFPRDKLFLVGFADIARELSRETLSQVTWNEYVYGTNMQHAFMLGRKLLGRERTQNKQFIVITDGEPTAHLEGDRPFFAYPPALKTIQETLKEVRRCTKEDIRINVFMLDRSRYLTDFIHHLTKINKGRVLFTTADSLGQYILVDYLSNKRKHILSS
ncbi:MAG: VWA domain-containing protein [Chloroflexi bacterium]|nr:VWA domain-containing protein [Chloroflexota bacterium]